MRMPFEASCVVTAQPVADPHGTVYLEVDSPLHGYVKHAYHAYRDHPDSDLVVFFFFCTPFRVLPVLCRPCIHEMRSDLQTFRLITRELWRVAIGGLYTLRSSGMEPRVDFMRN